MCNSETGCLLTLRLVPVLAPCLAARAWGNEEQGHGDQASSAGAACGAEQWVLLPEQLVQPAPHWQPGHCRDNQDHPPTAVRSSARCAAGTQQQREAAWQSGALLLLQPPCTAELPARGRLQ